MSITTTVVSVGTAATRLAGGAGDTSSSGFDFELFVPSGGATVYVGGSDVTTTNGRPLVAGSAFADGASEGDVIYGVVAAGTQDVHVYRRAA